MCAKFIMTPGRESMMKTGRDMPSSLCSPAQQRKDAVTGKPVPEGAKFGETSKTTNEYGEPVYTTPYSKQGETKSWRQFVAEGGDVEAAKKWREKKGSTTTPDINGYVQRTGFNLKPVGIKNLATPPNNEIITKPKRTLTPTDSTNPTLKTTAIGNVKKRVKTVVKKATNVNPVGGNNFNPGCLTGKN
jgi:hypothetical protein